MGRWRPAPPKSSPYITAEGADRLQKELKRLWKVERPEVTAIVKAAAANGDRSENGDYIYGKQRLREIDRRVRYLGKRLDDLTVVDRKPDNQGKIFFGAYVTLERTLAEEASSEDNTEFRVRIVGFDEIDATKNWISVDSPLAKAILGKQLDDDIRYNTPDGWIEAYITDIAYDE